MVAFRLEVDQASQERLRRLERETPKTFKRAFGFAAVGALRMLVSTVKAGGGKNGVPAFPAKTAFTREVDAQEHRARNWFGRIGKRPQLNRWREGGAQKIGFITAIEGWASSVQDSSRHEMTESQRAHFHAVGIHGVPTFYDRPARHVISPFSDYLVGGVYADMVAGAAEKISRGIIKPYRGGSSYSSAPRVRHSSGGGSHGGYYDHNNMRWV